MRQVSILQSFEPPFNLSVPHLLSMLQDHIPNHDNNHHRSQVPDSQFHILNKPSDRREGKIGSEKIWPEKICVSKTKPITQRHDIPHLNRKTSWDL